MSIRPLPITLAVALAGWLASAPTSTGQTGPDSATEHLELIIAQNQPLEISFQNVFDLDHSKLLELHGFLNGPVPGTLAVFFDWVDVSGNKFFSPVQEFQFFPGSQNPVDMAFTIPFCPPQVSV